MLEEADGTLRDGREGRSNPRFLTPRECARLMGFPDSFVIPGLDKVLRHSPRAYMTTLIEALWKISESGMRSHAHQNPGEGTRRFLSTDRQCSMPARDNSNRDSDNLRPGFMFIWPCGNWEPKRKTRSSAATRNSDCLNRRIQWNCALFALLVMLRSRVIVRMYQRWYVAN